MIPSWFAEVLQWIGGGCLVCLLLVCAVFLADVQAQRREAERLKKAVAKK